MTVVGLWQTAVGICFIGLGQSRGLAALHPPFYVIGFEIFGAASFLLMGLFLLCQAVVYKLFGNYVELGEREIFIRQGLQKILLKPGDQPKIEHSKKDGLNGMSEELTIRTARGYFFFKSCAMSERDFFDLRKALIRLEERQNDS